jgi:uncharacterized membrane protein YGL010W
MTIVSASDRFRRLLYEALIVPSAHTRVFDAAFQLEVYEVFHTRAATRWGHLFCTPVVNVSLLALATALPFTPPAALGWLTFDGAVLAALIALVLYVAVHGAWAVVMIPVLAVSVGLAQAVAAALGPSLLPVALAVAFTAALLQTFSHAFEPVPPPWSGGYRWITMKEFLVRTPPLRLAALSAIAVLIFPVLEFWASPRIWPVQIAQSMMRAGLWPARAERHRRRVHAILSDAREGWALPPLETD